MWTLIYMDTYMHDIILYVVNVYCNMPLGVGIDYVACCWQMSSSVSKFSPYTKFLICSDVHAPCPSLRCQIISLQAFPWALDDTQKGSIWVRYVSVGPVLAPCGRADRVLE